MGRKRDRSQECWTSREREGDRERLPRGYSEDERLWLRYEEAQVHRRGKMDVLQEEADDGGGQWQPQEDLRS